MKILVVMFLLLASCTEQEMSNSRRQWLGDGLTYYKDTRTELCFAGMSVGTNAQTVTYVPCTPQVEALAQSFLFTAKK